MHIDTKKTAFLGILLALSLILQLLGTGIAFSTLSFLVLSALCLGIAIYETNLTIGGCFLIASVTLSVLLTPNKLHCLSYICLCIYIYFQEILRRKTRLTKHFVLIWGIKFLFFNCCFILPCLLFFKELMFESIIEWNPIVYAVIIGTAQIFLILFDLIYQQLIPAYWNRLKQRLNIRL